MHQDDVRDRDPGARYARLAAPHYWRRFDMKMQTEIGLRELGSTLFLAKTGVPPITREMWL
jgi:hypothetical protein